MKPKDVIRKLVHILGFTVTFLIILVGLQLVTLLILSISLIYLLEEYMRLKGSRVPLLTAFTLKAARKDEKKTFIKEPIFYAAGILLSLILFPEPINLVSVATVTLGDGMSDLVGRFLGRTSLPYNRQKTIEGTLIGFLCATAGGMIFAPLYLSALGSAAGMIVESLPITISDNLTVPITAGLVMLLLV